MSPGREQRGYRRRARRDENGAVAIIVALFVTAALVLCALIADRGYFYFMRARLQTAVDAAALGAAQEFCKGGTDAAETTRVLSAIDTYAWANDEVVIDHSKVRMPTSGVNKYVYVPASQTISTFFGGLFDASSVAVGAVGAAARECLLSYRMIAIDRLEFNGGGVKMPDDPVWAGKCFTANKGTFGVVVVTTGQGANCPLQSMTTKPAIDNGYNDPAAGPIQGVRTPVWGAREITATAAATQAGVDELANDVYANGTTYKGVCKHAEAGGWTAAAPIDCTGIGENGDLSMSSVTFDQSIIAQRNITLPSAGTLTNALVWAREGDITIPAGLIVGQNTILYAPKGDVKGPGSPDVRGVVIANSITIEGGHYQGLSGAQMYGPGAVSLTQ